MLARYPFLDFNELHKFLLHVCITGALFTATMYGYMLSICVFHENCCTSIDIMMILLVAILIGPVKVFKVVMKLVMVYVLNKVVIEALKQIKTVLKMNSTGKMFR